MTFHDFLVYKEIEGRMPKHSPRRIVSDEYHIEWHRKGIQFVKCLDGWLRNQKETKPCFRLEMGTIVPWDCLNNQDRYDITTLSGEKQYVIKVYNRSEITTSDLLNGFKVTINEEINANKEILWYVANNYEERWQQNKSSREAIQIIEELKDLPKGIDDELCNLLLSTWQQRLKEQLVFDLYSNDEKLVMESIDCLKQQINK